MPSHKIHVAIAQEINKELKLNNDEISLGSVLPDLALINSHSIPHFQINKEYPNNLANPDEFIKRFGKNIDAIFIGYLIHLITDRFYNQKYLEKFFIFDDNKPFKLVSYIKPEKRRGIKKHDFHEYDKYLVDLGNIIPFSGFDVVDKVNNYGKDITFNKEELKKYIEKFNIELKEKNLNYDFLCWKKEELDNIYFECLKYIHDYFKKNELIK